MKEEEERMELGHCFRDVGILFSNQRGPKDVPGSHNPLATHSPMRGMSKGFKEEQESSSRQATPAPGGRHSLCIKVKQ